MRHLMYCLTLITVILMVVACQSREKKENEVTSSVQAVGEKTEFSIAELKKRTFNYFWLTADSENFQIPDRFPTLTFSSIAATGFGLSAYITGIENKYITREQGAQRVMKTLDYLWTLPQGPEKSGISGYKGFFYHFLTLDDAVRFKEVELSSIDTGLLMAGILSCMTYFDQENDTERQIRSRAEALYRRVDWKWMLNKNNRLSMGWHPEKGFIESDWKGYNEAMVLLIMAIGSPTHPIPASCWKTWCDTYTFDTFKDQENVQFDPLFGHQYSHIWIDFRGIQDAYMRGKKMDYFENSKRATLSNRQYCIDNPGGYKGYGPDCWGLTACDGPSDVEMDIEGKKYTFFGYRARGASSELIVDDGTLAPTAAGGSYPFTPELSEKALRHMWDTYYQGLIGEFGFKDAFNPSFKNNENPHGWFDKDYLGIDQGPILLQIENHQSQLIWNIMKKNPYIRDGLLKAGFEGGWLTAEE